MNLDVQYVDCILKIGADVFVMKILAMNFLLSMYSSIVRNAEQRWMGVSDMYYKAKNVDTYKAIKAIKDAREHQRIEYEKEFARIRGFLEGIEKGLDIAQGIFECSNYEKE